MPRTFGLCTDESVNGAPFYVMSFVEGHIVRDDGRRLIAAASRARAGESLVDTLAVHHAVDVDTIGSETSPAARLHRPPAQAVARPVHPVDRGRRAGAGGGRPVHQLLAARIPDQQGVAIVHGDYRLDNTVLDD